MSTQRFTSTVATINGYRYFDFDATDEVDALHAANLCAQQHCPAGSRVVFLDLARP